MYEKLLHSIYGCGCLDELESKYKSTVINVIPMRQTYCVVCVYIHTYILYNDKTTGSAGM